MIDWEKFAKDHDLTPQEFTNEIFMVTAILSAMIIDKGAPDVLHVSEDEVGIIEIRAIRIPFHQESETKH